MKNLKIDINADVGEGIGNEDLLFPLISSCNIACGGHSGDLETMLSVVRLAKKNNLKIGAHPSFPDKKNFGRKIMNISKDILIKSLKNQIQSLRSILIQENVELNHIKAHGACSLEDPQPKLFPATSTSQSFDSSLLRIKS